MKWCSILAVFLALMVLGAPMAGAQAAADIYGAADLAPEGAVAGVMGTATLAHAGADTQVMLAVQGLAASSAVTAHIHKESCSGPVVGILSAASAADGTAQATGQVPGVLDFTAGGTWMVDLHLPGDKGSGAALCSQFHPALAAGGLLPPPVSGPGMPVAGGPPALSPWLLLLGGGLLLGGCMLVVRRRRA